MSLSHLSLLLLSSSLARVIMSLGCCSLSLPLQFPTSCLRVSFLPMLPTCYSDIVPVSFAHPFLALLTQGDYNLCCPLTVPSLGRFVPELLAHPSLVFFVGAISAPRSPLTRGLGDVCAWCHLGTLPQRASSRMQY